MEKTAGIVAAGSFEEDVGAEDVGADEGFGVFDGAVYVALGSEVDDRIEGRSGGGEDGFDAIGVGNVCFVEGVAIWVGGGDLGEVFGVSCIGEEIDVRDVNFGVIAEDVVDEITSDEAAASCDENFHGF